MLNQLKMRCPFAAKFYSESVHDPKTSKLSATGASLINMYKDSSKKYLEIVKSHCKEIDSSMVESTACSKPNLGKIDDQFKHVDSNNSDAKHADEPKKGLETCLQVTADINETVGNNTVDDVSHPVAKEPTKVPTNSSSFEAALSHKESSLTNGTLKAVTESNSLEVKVISMDTPLTAVAEPLEMHIVEKESKHLDAKTSLEQTLTIERTSLVNQQALDTSMDSNNVSGQIVSEIITAKASEQDCKDKDIFHRTAVDKDVQDSKDKEELHRLALDKGTEKHFKDKEEFLRSALDKEVKEDYKDNAKNEPEEYCKVIDELQRTALGRGVEESKDKEEMQRTALNKKSEEDCKGNKELQNIVFDKEPEVDCNDKKELERTHLDKEPEDNNYKDKKELERTHLDEEPEVDCKDKKELERTHLDKEPEDNNYKDKNELERTHLAKEPEKDWNDKKEFERTHLDKHPEVDCKDKNEFERTHLAKEPEDDCKDKKELEKIHLDKEPEEDCMDKKELERSHLNKEPEDDFKDKKELQINLDKEPEECCKVNDEWQRTDLDKEPEKDCKVIDELQRTVLDKEPEEDCKVKAVQVAAFEKEAEGNCKDKDQVQRSALDKEREGCKDNIEVETTDLDKEIEEDCKNIDMHKGALDKEIEDFKDIKEVHKVALDKESEDFKDIKEVHKVALDKIIEEDCNKIEEAHKVTLLKDIQNNVCKDMENVQSVALDKAIVIAEGQSKEGCEDTLPKEKSKDVGSLEKSNSSVTTSAHSGGSKDEELTPILDISVVDQEVYTKRSNFVENVDDIDLKPEAECSNVCQEIEIKSPAKLDEVPTNSSVDTEQPTQKVENIAAAKSDETVLSSRSKDYSVIELNESNSSKEDGAVAAHIPEEEESESSDVESKAVATNEDTHLDVSANDEDTSVTTNSVGLLKVTSKSMFIDLCDSADEPDNGVPGEANVSDDDSQQELTIDLDEHNGEATAPKSEIKEDVDKVVSIIKVSIEENAGSSKSVDMEPDETLVKYDVGSCVQVDTTSPPTNGNKGDSTFDMLLKDEINKTSESITCKTQVGKAQQSQADVSPMTKENDVSTGDIQGSSLSTDRDDSSGFSVQGQKRTSFIDNPIETKKAKLTNGHDTDVITNSRKDVTSIDPTNERTCTKRSLEFPDGLESKKARVLSVDESSSNSCTSTMSNEHVSKKSEEEIAMEEPSTVPAIPRKSLSNIDKAIERVAFAGLDRKERIMMPFIKDLKNRRLHDITIDDLEELVTQRMGEVLSETGENGVLREKVQKLEKMTEFWKHKAASLQKQLSDMTMVFKKLATETKQNSNQMQIPIKITRSVGLQVIMPSLQSVSKSNATHVRNGLSPGTKRKSGGIMTNRNTTPTLHYPSSTVMSPNRTPVVQKVVTPATVKPPQATLAPKPPVVPPLPPAIRFRAPTTTVASSATGTVVTVAGNLRTAASITANRPVVKSVTPRSAPPPGGDTLIDLTDEDDRTRRVTSNPLGQQLRVAQLNGSPPALGSTIRFSPSQQLTGIATGVNGQRLTYMLPASAANATSGRLQLFTQQTGGNLRPSGLVTVRPSTQTQTLVLKNGAVVSTAASPSSVMRAGTTTTFQQVVTRPGQMRTIQPASRPVAMLPPPLHAQHPAPLPPPPPEFPSNPSWKKPPPRPDLKISKVDNREQHGIILSWNMDHGTEHEEIASYQLYAYQENSSPPSTSQWKKVGDVKAMPLPMACTLTQFLEGNKYHFAVRAIDIHSRSGLFSIPGHIILPRRGS